MSLDNQALFAHLFPTLPEGWILKPLADVVDYQEGPGILAVDFHETGIPLLRLSSIVGKKTSFYGCNFLDPNKVEKKWSHFKLQEGDILLSTSGSLGRVSVVAKEQEGSICYTGIIRFRPKIDGIKPAFIEYFLQSNLFEQQALASASGSVLSHFGPSHLKKMSFPVPPENYQIFMERLISPIDSKIELNNQINQTLEAMAQAIFKSWFVDFEPVKAKMSVLQAGGSRAEAELAAMMAISGKTSEQLSTIRTTQAYQQLSQTAALFPAAMQESELGEIPEGWEVRGLDSIANYLNGLALQKFRPKDGEGSLPVLKIAQLKAGVADSEESASVNIKPEYVVDNGDIIFSWSGSLVVDIWCGGKAALNQHLFKVTSTEYPKWFFYFFTKHHLNEFQRIAAAKAVTMGHIKREHLTSALCAVDEKAIQSVNKTLSDLLEHQITLRIQNRQLSDLRDNLLPKLLSGELDLSASDEVAT